jgi:hypothetical protein
MVVKITSEGVTGILESFFTLWSPPRRGGPFGLRRDEEVTEVSKYPNYFIK